MHLSNCVICSDIFDISSNISATICGHTFHDKCLLRWLEQSKSCPTCRLPVKKGKIIHKLFFNIPADDSFNESNNNPSYLRTKIINLEHTVNEKDNRIKYLTERIESIESSLETANSCCVHLKSENEKLETKMSSMQSKLRILNKKSKDFDDVQSKCEELKNELDLFKSIRNAISGSAEDLEIMLNSYSRNNDIKSLVTLCTILKKELHATTDKRNKLKEKFNGLRSKNNLLSQELFHLKDKLRDIEENFEYSERERLSLEEKLREFEEKKYTNDMNESSVPSNSSIRNESLAPEPTPSPLRKFKCRPHVPLKSDLRETLADVENLPSKLSNFGLFNKKRKIAIVKYPAQQSTKVVKKLDDILSPGLSHTYDGLGGHKRFIGLSDLKNSRLDNNKNITKQKKRKRTSESFNQLNITDQLILLD